MPLSNIDSSMVSQYDQYRVFLEITKQKISFEAYKRYRSCLIWSPKELHAAGQFKNVYSPISLSASFSVTRPAQDVADWATRANTNHISRERDCTAFLCVYSDSEITLEENKLSIIDVRLPEDGVLARIRGAGNIEEKETVHELGTRRN